MRHRLTPSISSYAVTAKLPRSVKETTFGIDDVVEPLWRNGSGEYNDRRDVGGPGPLGLSHFSVFSTRIQARHGMGRGSAKHMITGVPNGHSKHRANTQGINLRTADWEPSASIKYWLSGDRLAQP